MSLCINMHVYTYMSLFVHILTMYRLACSNVPNPVQAYRIPDALDVYVPFYQIMSRCIGFQVT